MLLAAGAFAVKAYPGQTNPCGNCHTATGVLVLTSNATGTVDATVGVPFVLIVNQTGYSGGDGKIAVAMRPGWSDNAQFTFVEESVVDGDASDLNPTADQVTVSFTLTPLAEGSWNIHVWTAGKSGMVGTNLEVPVTVSAATTTTTTTTTTPTTTTTTDTTSTTTTTSTGTPPPTEPVDFTLVTVTLVGFGIIIVIVIVVYLPKRTR